MAVRDDAWPDNVMKPGAEGLPIFYVDQQCISCALCADIAPAHFEESDQGEHYICHSQPQDEEQVSLCRDAMEGCPVDAIGEEG